VKGGKNLSKRRFALSEKNMLSAAGVPDSISS